MDELELLKKEWKRQEKELPKLSYDEIYKMILKRSSSIVKWIFIISIIEFVIWVSVDIIFRVTGDLEGLEHFEAFGIKGFYAITTVLSYGILIYFILRFYVNYKKIQVTDSAKVLMQNILKTRKSVRRYVVVNLSFMSIVVIIITGNMLFFTDKLVTEPTGKEVPVLLIIMSTILMLALAIGILALFYRLIYGILTRRLKRNYKELEKLEI